MKTVVVLVLLSAFWAVVILALRGRRQGLAAARTRDPEEFQNHLDMARLIERLMENDFVRGVIPEPDQNTARRVLRQFYGDSDEREIRP